MLTQLQDVEEDHNIIPNGYNIGASLPDWVALIYLLIFETDVRSKFAC